MRWPRQLVSLLFVLSLLAGPPVVLLYLVGPPLRGWPTAVTAREWVRDPLTEHTLTAALTIAAWMVWLLLAYTVTIRVVARLSATVSWLRRVPLPTPLQATASGIAGAAVFGVASNAIATPSPPATQPVAAGSLDDVGIPTPLESVLHDDGISVSGGWMSREMAEQVSAAAALVWLRRRRDYRPRQLGQPSREDPALVQLPATVAAVQAALADTPPPPPSKAGTTSAGASLLGVPTTGGTFPRVGVGLTGAGAVAAARGLLLTSLLAGQRRPRVSVVVTRPVLSRLLGPAADMLGRRLPGLAVVDKLGEASRFFPGRATERGLDGRDHAQRHLRETTDAGRGAPVLIVDEAAATDSAESVARLAIDAAAVAVLGTWSAGHTWQVDPLGHTNHLDAGGRPGPRICVLTRVTATDLLTILAHPDPSPPEPGVSGPFGDGALPVRSPRWQATGKGHQVRSGEDHRRLELRVLGEPMLLLDGRPLTIRRTAAIQVLVFLAAHPDGADTRQLTDAIWPGLPRRSLTGRLYTTLSELRATVRSAAGVSIIEHNDDRYRFDPACVTVDLWRFHHAIRDATTAVTPADAATWKTVIDAYPADFAARRSWPWLGPIREAARRHVIDAHAALASRAPDARQAIAWLQAGIRIDPYNADLHARVVDALIALGDHDAADHTREGYARRLAAAGILPHDTALTTTIPGQPVNLSR
ncbi:hypothetical protein ACLQ24_25615 [Micromonospora sp. DT4]|uniref:hypothetical protein n=1 Tax=Micromonospora sp. DT4 TaxID=3393438 RepID=UPI003CFA0989